MNLLCHSLHIVVLRPSQLIRAQLSRYDILDGIIVATLCLHERESIAFMNKCSTYGGRYTTFPVHVYPASLVIPYKSQVSLPRHGQPFHHFHFRSLCGAEGGKRVASEYEPITSEIPANYLAKPQKKCLISKWGAVRPLIRQSRFPSPSSFVLVPLYPTNFDF